MGKWIKQNKKSNRCSIPEWKISRASLGYFSRNAQHHSKPVGVKVQRRNNSWRKSNCRILKQLKNEGDVIFGEKQLIKAVAVWYSNDYYQRHA